jgi:uncharacterized tellurite resistance protein B-like protein
MTLLTRLFGSKTTGHEPGVRLFVETMLLMIAADGQVDDAEMAQFMREVQQRPELAGLTQEMIDEHVDASFQSIKDEGIPKRVKAIADGLRDREQRIAAATMAVSIGLDEDGLATAEATLLRMLSEAFELSAEDVAGIIEAGRRGRVESILAGHASVQQYYVEVMMLMAAADGDFDPSELDVFADRLATHPAFEDLQPDTAGVYMERALSLLAEEGVEARLDAIDGAMTHPEQRETAFRLAVQMCLADGVADDHEKELLKLMRERFHLTDDFVAEELKATLGTLN